MNLPLKLGIEKTGIANGELNHPWGIAFDSKNQHVIVSDKNNHRLQSFDRQHLTHHSTVGSYGSNLGQLDSPSGLCLQPQTDQLLVCDWGNHRVQVLSAQSQPTKLIGSGQSSEVNYPFGVCCSPDGSLAVTEWNNCRVQRFDATGRFLSTFGSEGRGESQFKYPYDLCHLHHHFAPSSSASSLLLVTDWSNKRLSIWSADGRQHLTNIKMNGNVRGLCVDLNGFVYASCQSQHVVCIYDPRKSYQLLQTLGGEQGSAPGQFYFPTGMCVDDLNTLMVVDCGNHRVQFFD